MTRRSPRGLINVNSRLLTAEEASDYWERREIAPGVWVTDRRTEQIVRRNIADLEQQLAAGLVVDTPQPKQRKATDKKLKVRTVAGGFVWLRLPAAPVADCSFFAEQMRDHLTTARACLDKLDRCDDLAAARAAAYDIAYELLLLADDMRCLTVVDNETKIDVGDRQIDALARRRDPHNAMLQRKARAEHSRWIAKAKELWAAQPGLKITPCARMVIKRLDLKQGLKTVADVIRPHKPQKSGDTS